MTKKALLEAIGRLAVNYGRSTDARMLGTYHAGLHELTDAQLEAATTRAIRELAMWPSVAQLRALAGLAVHPSEARPYVPSVGETAAALALEAAAVPDRPAPPPASPAAMHARLAQLATDAHRYRTVYVRDGAECLAALRWCQLAQAVLRRALGFAHFRPDAREADVRGLTVDRALAGHAVARVAAPSSDPPLVLV